MLFQGYLLFSIVLALAYAALQGYYVYHWRRMPVWEIPHGWVPSTTITVLLPARNEADTITACLNSILAGSYPAALLELLVIDDFSADDTAAMAEQLPGVRVLRLSRQPDAGLGGKKKALEAGVAAARGELIVTTDADCLLPPDWLRLLSSLYEARRPGAIVAPVAIHRDRNILQHFQALDLAGMVGITGAGIHLGWHRMGNGANLCYPKSSFDAVHGYSGNRHLASGDDLFLLQKIARREQVVFLKNNGATALTEAPASLRVFAQQRLRWGSKSTALPEVGVKVALALIFLFCCSLLLNVLLLGFLPALAGIALAQLALKAWADYILLSEMCRFFKRRDLIRWFWPSAGIHTLYIAWIGAWSLLVTKYTWKGRRLR